MSAREVVSAEALHAEHMREFAWLEDDGFTADKCGNCQRWARYASAALAAEPAEAVTQLLLGPGAVYVDVTPPAEQRCACGGRLVPESRRGVEHRICVECNGCARCDTEPVRYTGSSKVEATYHDGSES